MTFSELLRYHRPFVAAVFPVLLFFSAAAQSDGAQNIGAHNINISLAGKVVDDKTGTALPGATVHIQGTTHEVLTDKNGEFRFLTGQRPPLVLLVS